MAKRHNRDRGSIECLNAYVDDMRWVVNGFNDEANCKVHILKHILGLNYKDHWDKEGWSQIDIRFSGIEQKTMLHQLLEIGCEAVKKKAKAHEVGSAFALYRECFECDEKVFKRCNSILGALSRAYKEVTCAAVASAYEIPRFTHHKENYEYRKVGAYFLDGRAVNIAGTELGKNTPGQLSIVISSGYRPFPENLDPPNGQRTWSTKEYLKWGKEKVKNKWRTGKITFLGLYTRQTWDFDKMDTEDHLGNHLSGPTKLRDRRDRPTTPRRRTCYTVADMIDQRTRQSLEIIRSNIIQSKHRRRTG